VTLKLRLGRLALSACAAIPVIGAPPQEFQIRLLTPLASYSKPGTRFEAKVIGATATPLHPGLPPHTRIFGSVVRGKATGLGIRRERAVLELDFDDECVLPSGEAVACDVTLTSVDNARESVKDGEIRGILAASHPNSWLSGLWFRPDVDLIHRSAMGLTGAGGMIYTQLMPGPAGAALMIGSHLLLFRMPDPEIELPSGTDLIVQVEAGVSPSQIVPKLARGGAFPEELLERLAAISPQVTKPGDVAAMDLVNVALMGDREQVVKAFDDAGWSTTGIRSAKTLARTYSAYAGMKTYASAPVSPMYHDGLLPDLVFQKSFNTLAMRHHIRLWQVETPDGTVWVGAATHDVAIEFHASRMSLAHRVDPFIDREKNVLFNDLNAAGCLTAIQGVERPELSQPDRTPDSAVTDGTLTVGSLRDCTSPEEDGVMPLQPRRSFGALFVRQVILDTRQYVERGNAYYWTYSGLRRMYSSRKPDEGDQGGNSVVARRATPKPQSAAAVRAAALRLERRKGLTDTSKTSVALPAPIGRGLVR